MYWAKVSHSSWRRPSRINGMTWWPWTGGARGSGWRLAGHLQVCVSQTLTQVVQTVPYSLCVVRRDMHVRFYLCTNLLQGTWNIWFEESLAWYLALGKLENLSPWLVFPCKSNTQLSIGEHRGTKIKYSHVRLFFQQIEYLEIKLQDFFFYNLSSN